MTDYASVLSAARALPAQDRLRLLDALWDCVPAESDVPFSDEWMSEIDSRLDELEAGNAQTVSWSTVRDEALARLGHGKAS